MKTKETSTLYTTMSNNIGQVKKQDAQKEIERLNKQENTNSWRMDESDFMFIEDETDEDVRNPIERQEGYVWITCEPKSTRQGAFETSMKNKIQPFEQAAIDGVFKEYVAEQLPTVHCNQCGNLKHGTLEGICEHCGNFGKTATNCRDCGGKGKPSKAYTNFHNIRYPHDGSKAEFETKFVDCIKCELCGHSWIPEGVEQHSYESNQKQIYITVATSGLTILANKVARKLQPDEDAFMACSELANDIAKDNGLEWSNVLVQYFNHYSDERPAIGFKVPQKIETEDNNARDGKFSKRTTREEALIWWNNLPRETQGLYWFKFRDNNFTPSTNPSRLTGREIEAIYTKEIQIWRKEMGDLKLHKGEVVNNSYPEDFQKAHSKPNKKKFQEFNHELAKAYLNKFDTLGKQQFCLEAFNMLSQSELIYLKHCLNDIISERAKK